MPYCLKELSNTTKNVTHYTRTRAPSRDLNHVFFENEAGLLPVRREPGHSRVPSDDKVKNAASLFLIFKLLCAYVHIYILRPNKSSNKVIIRREICPSATSSTPNFT
jgi:hypothetical protein